MTVISRIVLQNIRGFRHLELDCTPRGDSFGSQTVIVGRNGTGKTTLLRAIALALCDEPDANVLIGEPIGSLIRNSSSVATIRCSAASRSKLGDWESVSELLGNPPKRNQIMIHSVDRKDAIVNMKRSQNIVSFACGYGIGRSRSGSLEQTSQSYRIADSVRSLFDYSQTLQDPELTLRRLQDFSEDEVAYRRTLDGIKLCLGLSVDDTLLLEKGGGIVIEGPSVNGKIPFEAWADGYRATFRWLIDLYGWAIRANKFEFGVSGVLLIDEIEQHLHPSLQTGILPRLAKLLPHMQIIVTTHSPLVALGADPRDVVVLKEQGDKTVQVKDVPDFRGYLAEDMLTDPHLFDTKNVYNPQTSAMREEYHDLASIPNSQMSLDEQSRLRTLANQLRQQQVPEFRQPRIDPALQKILEKYELT